MNKIPLERVVKGVKVKILSHGVGLAEYGTIYTVRRDSEHYSDTFPHLPCLNNNWCGCKYELVKPKITLIIKAKETKPV